jgi:hypothetical protein
VPEESSFPTVKRFLLGKPVPSHLAHHERLSRVTGLAVLSSDALSSVAYATDFIVATLIVSTRLRASAESCIVWDVEPLFSFVSFVE